MGHLWLNEWGHLWLNGWGHLWLNGWGIYGLMCGAFMAEWVGAFMASWCFIWKNSQKKMLVFRGDIYLWLFQVKVYCVSEWNIMVSTCMWWVSQITVSHQKVMDLFFHGIYTCIYIHEHITCMDCNFCEQSGQESKTHYSYHVPLHPSLTFTHLPHQQVVWHLWCRWVTLFLHSWLLACDANR